MADWRRTTKSGEQPGGSRSIAPESFMAGQSVSDRAADHGIKLDLCPCCGSQLVYPTNWAPAAPRRWRVELRCPECDWTGCGVYPQSAVDRFDQALDAATESLLADLHMLVRANMEEQVEAFVAALDDDRILPEDF
jgi:hypothetical protein